MAIIQGQKGMFGKGGLLGEGVFRKGVLGEEEKHRKTIEEYDTNMGIIQG